MVYILFVKVNQLNLNFRAEAPSVNTGDGRENTGSTNDESDILKVLNCVKISTTFQGPLSMGRGKEQLKQVEKKLKVAFREFYQKLQLLKSYRQKTMGIKICNQYTAEPDNNVL